MPPRQFPETFRSLSDADWFKLLAASVRQPVINGVEFPGFPPAALQEQFVGQSGIDALRSAYSFYVFAKTQMQSLGHPLTRESRVLDFGCGWGRFLRFFWKDVDADNLYGCDSNAMIIDLCESLGVPGHLAVVDPRGRLPYPDAFFDGVLSYAVFTHLPEAVHRHWVEELTRVSRQGAVVCLTLESRRFLDAIASLAPDTTNPRLALLRPFQPALARHVTEYETRGFTYFPSVNGLEDVYGDAVCSAGFMAAAWRDAFDLKTYIDHASQMSQATVCLQRISAVTLPFDSRIEREVRDIRQSGLFDPVYYAAMYPDIQPPPVDPIHHYCVAGWREGRNPSDEFDTRVYREAYHDVTEAEVNPLWHYVVRGRSEGRSAVADVAFGCEDDVPFDRVRDDVLLIAYYANPDWPILRQGLANDRGAGWPLVPHLDLGFYDVTRAGTLSRQAAMCRNHGVTAWCFTVDASTLSDTAHPLITFLDNPDIKIGFVLDVDLRASCAEGRVRDLVERAFADDRCLRVDGRPVVVLSLPDGDDDCHAALLASEALFDRSSMPYRIARRDGLPTSMVVAGTRLSFDAILDFPLSPVPGETGNVVPRSRSGVDTVPYGFVVSEAIRRMGLKRDEAMCCYRAVTLGRDESLLGCKRPLRYTRSSLQDYRRWLDAAIANARAVQPRGLRMVFLNAWNDWSRGAVLEPDRLYGYSRLNETSRALLGLPLGLPSPKVSIVVMSSDQATHLRRRLESVYRQTYGNVEVLLLDDGSSLESRSIFAEYVDRFPMIATRVLQADPVGGIFRQWARGLEAATGELVWIAGADGSCDEKFVETLVRCFDDEAVMVASAKVEYVGPDDAIIPEGFQGRVRNLACRDKWRQSYVSTAHREVAESLGSVNTIPSASGLVFRRPSTLSLLADEEWLSMEFAGDWIFYLHAMRGGRIAYTTDTCAYVSMPLDESRTAGGSPDTVVRELTAVARAVASLYDTPPSTLEAFWSHAAAHPALDGISGAAAIAAAELAESMRDARRARSPNIAVAAMGFYPGGAEIQPIRIANELKRQGHSVVFLSAGFGTRESRVRRLLRGDVPVIETQDVQLTKQLLHEFGIEALNSHAWIVQNYPSTVPDVFSGLSAHVATLHGMIEHGNESTVSPANLRRADEQVSTWVYTAEKNLGPFFENGLYDAASSRFMKLPNGMEPPVIDPVRRRDIGIPDDAFVLCCVSRAIPDKGWAETIEAVARARTMTGRDIRLILVGAGPLHDDYCRSGVPNFVSLMGFHENSVSFYAAADMGIMLTRFKSESFPLTIIESLFAGRPFIATDVGEIRGMLSTGHGLAGDLIPLENWQVPVERAAEVIARHAQHPQLVVAARERAVEAAAKFRIDRVAAAYVALFSRDTEASSRMRTARPLPVRSAASWTSRIETEGCTTIDAVVDRYCSQRPGWVAGDISRSDARFLLCEALDAQTSHVVEIGTASGMSAGLLCLVLDVARQVGLVGDDFRVVSYDLAARFYADTNRLVGDAAREILDDDTLSHIVFRNPATALDAAREHKPNSVRFLFIDASHSHPWPALDLLATLPILAAGATVVLHDVNLPLVLPQFPDWGAHHLFHGLSLEKRLAAEGYRPGAHPNVGSVVIPADKTALREEILGIIAAHRWETDVPDSVLVPLGVKRHSRPIGTPAPLVPVSSILAPVRDHAAADDGRRARFVTRTMKSRDVMLGVLPRQIACAEVGGLEVDHSARILEVVEPSELYLLDLFGGDGTSGGQKRAKAREHALAGEYARLHGRYRHTTSVHFRQGLSENTLRQLPDHALDFVSIDSDRTFDGLFFELELAFHKLRDGGFLCGRPYSAEHHPASTRAVDLFCSTYGQEIECLTDEDAMSSFLIRLRKTDQSFTDSLQSVILGKGLSMISRARFRSLKAGIDHVLAKAIPGNIVEAGVWRGGAVIFMVKYLQYLSDSVSYCDGECRIEPKRHVVACDSFMGLPEPCEADVMFDGTHASTHDFRHLKVSKAEFLENLAAFNIRQTDLTVLEGWFEHTLQRVEGPVSLLRMGGDYYESTMTTLERLYDKVSPGGIILIDDYRWWDGCQRAVHDFLRRRNLSVDLIQTPEDDTEAWFMKPA